MSSIAEGLEGVVVTRTSLSDVDGEAGRLVIGGFAVEQLAGRMPFESACHLLLIGRPPSDAEHAVIKEQLGAARVAAFRALESRAGLLDRADGMDALRAAVASLPSAEATVEESIALTGATATFVAAYARKRLGLELCRPDPALGHAEDFLRMVRGEATANPTLARALDAYLVTVIDHGMNASTFAARVVASTGSDLVSAIAAAVGALKGPLHGGAPGPVLDMLDAIGEPARAEAWLEGELAAKRRIMGMGHRVYRVRDPRAAVLERTLGELEASLSASARLALARAVEKAAASLLAKKYPDRALKTNVEFYTAVLLDAVGLPRWLFSSTFAVGRVAGWCAHVREQKARGRLIRPSSEYDGPAASSGDHPHEQTVQ